MEDIYSRGTSDSSMYFATHSAVKHTDEEFRMEISSMGRYQWYAMSPQHAKRLLSSLKKQVEGFEEKFGQIKEAPKAPSAPSPVRKFGFIIPQDPQQFTERKDYRKVMSRKGQKKSK